MIDASAYIGEWPFRRLPCSQSDALLGSMDILGIEQAVVSRLENVFYKDLMVGNRELHALVRAHPDRLIPAYTMNPGFPGWAEDLELALEEFGMQFLRLHPNYHQYSMTTGDGLSLLEKATEHHLVALLAVGLEDPRHHHWLARVPNVSAIEIVETINRFPELRFLVTGGTFSEVSTIWRKAQHTQNVYIENSRVQGPIDDVEQLCRLAGEDRVLFGSNSPLHYHQSAQLSIEHANVSASVKDYLFDRNARSLFGL